jgi:hypothetical protein
MKPHAKTATGGANSAQMKARTTGKSSSGKADNVLKKLHSARGITIAQIAEMTGWQTHSVRGFLSGVVKKKLRLDLVSEVGKDGLRRYRVTEVGDHATEERLRSKKKSRRESASGYGANRGDAGVDSGTAAHSSTEVGDEAAPTSVVIATPKA